MRPTNRLKRPGRAEKRPSLSSTGHGESQGIEIAFEGLGNLRLLAIARFGLMRVRPSTLTADVMARRARSTSDLAERFAFRVRFAPLGITELSDNLSATLLTPLENKCHACRCSALLSGRGNTHGTIIRQNYRKANWVAPAPCSPTRLRPHRLDPACRRR